MIRPCPVGVWVIQRINRAFEAGFSGVSGETSRRLMFCTDCIGVMVSLSPSARFISGSRRSTRVLSSPMPR
ncbi:hypothetical protein D3C75_1264120 [compost metagenome]